MRLRHVSGIAARTWQTRLPYRRWAFSPATVGPFFMAIDIPIEDPLCAGRITANTGTTICVARQLRHAFLDREPVRFE
jgi:hypothetical protein